MRKSLLILLTASSLLVFTACSKPAERIEPTEPTQISTVADTTGSTELAPPEQWASASASFLIYQGTITELSADMTSLTLQDTGIQDPVVLDITATDMENTAELTAGTEITVYSSADNKAIIIADKQDSPSIKQAQGNVSSQAMSTFSIKQTDGTELIFLKNNTEGLSSDILGTSINDNNGTDAIVLVTYAEISTGDGTSTLIPIKTERVS